MTKAGLLDALSFPNVQAFLAVIREGESSQSEDAYRVMFGGGLFNAPPWAHPKQTITIRGVTSTAAGAYQFLGRTWDALVGQCGFEDFSPANQDLGAIALIAGRKALDAVKEGRINEAIRLCAKEWASLPGSPYGQPTLTLARALNVYVQHGGTLAPAADPLHLPTPAAPAQVKPMGAALLAFLPQILQLIPALGSLFRSGSEVATRNIAAASVVGDAIVKATNAVNVQDAVERMQADKDALEAATVAVHELLPQLMEGGGGGVSGARTFAADHENSRYGRILEVVTYAALAFLALANGLSFAAAYIKDDYGQIAAVIQADIGVGLMAFGFFLGSSLSSKRKDEVRGVQ